MPIQVFELYKEWVCHCLLAVIAGSNPAGEMDVCLLRMLCFVPVDVYSTDRSLTQRNDTE